MDVISRGHDQSLIQTENIWRDPTWLKEDAKSWPKIRVYEVSNKMTLPGTHKTTSVNFVPVINKEILFIDRYSSLTRLLRVIAYCVRFFRNMQNIMNKEIFIRERY